MITREDAGKLLVGCIGLGAMGAPIANHIQNAGFQLIVYNRSPHKAEPFQQRGAKVVSSPREMALINPNAVIISVSDDNALEEVLYGEQGLVRALRVGTLVIDTSTVSSETACRAALVIENQHSWFLDAPVTGGVTGALEGKLVSLVGGSQSTLNIARPYLETYSSRIEYCGPHSAGQRMKALNQILVALTTLATAETLRAAQILGMQTDAVLKILGQGYGRSHIFSELGERIVRGDLTSGFRADLLHKDLCIVADELSRTRNKQGKGSGLRGVNLVLELLEHLSYLDIGSTPATQALVETCATQFTPDPS